METKGRNNSVKSDSEEMIPSTSKASSSKPAKQYRNSLAHLMYEWAKKNEDFEVIKEQLRAARFQNEEDVEKLAFFQYMEQVGKNINVSIKKYNFKNTEKLPQIPPHFNHHVN